MDFAGLLGKFSANRPLTEQEARNRLYQQRRLDVAPHYQMCVIKMNSTYLESVDKWFSSKGEITQIMMVIIVIFLIFFATLLHTTFKRGADGAGEDDTAVLIFCGVLICPMLGLAIWTLRKEAFAFTHYPIRFNRQTRMVHVFRTKGTVLSVPWDQVFFTLAPIDHVYKFWNIMGHILADDNETVLESFALSISETGEPNGLMIMRSHWEFVRRYMEEGPASVTEQIEFCLPIGERRESLAFGLHRLVANTSGSSALLWPIRLIGIVMEISTLPFRYFAIQTCKIPRWPDQIDAVCVIEPNDPYAIMGAQNADRIAVFPAAAEAAGVGFKTHPKNPLVPSPAGSNSRQKKH